VNDWSTPQSAKAKNIDAESEAAGIGNAAQPLGVTRN
jgi:hypothetical protein